MITLKTKIKIFTLIFCWNVSGIKVATDNNKKTLAFKIEYFAFLPKTCRSKIYFCFILSKKSYFVPACLLPPLVWHGWFTLFMSSFVSMYLSNCSSMDVAILLEIWAQHVPIKYIYGKNCACNADSIWRWNSLKRCERKWKERERQRENTRVRT